MRAVSLVGETAKAVDTADRKVCSHSALRIVSESTINGHGPTLALVHITRKCILVSHASIICPSIIFYQEKLAFSFVCGLHNSGFMSRH